MTSRPCSRQTTCGHQGDAGVADADGRSSGNGRWPCRWRRASRGSRTPARVPWRRPRRRRCASWAGAGPPGRGGQGIGRHQVVGPGQSRCWMPAPGLCGSSAGVAIVRRDLAPELLTNRGFAAPRVTVVGSYAVGMTLRTDRFPVGGETRHGSDFDMGPGGKGRTRRSRPLGWVRTWSWSRASGGTRSVMRPWRCLTPTRAWPRPTNRSTCNTGRGFHHRRPPARTSSSWTWAPTTS